MDKDLTRIKQSSLRYWFEDGLSEIVIGALFMVIGIFNLLQGLLEPGSIVSGLSGLILIFLVTFGILLSRSLIKTFKERLTYPRTGYVSYPKSTSLQRVVSAFLGISFAVIVIWLARISSQTSITWTPLILGFALAGFMIVIGFRTSLLRYQVMATLILISGVVLSISGIPDWLLTGIMFSIQGLMLAISGIIALVHYLAQSQPHQGNVHDGWDERTES